MNTRVKGSRNELRAKKILEMAGYEVIKKVHTKFDPGDFFTLFDLIAVSTQGWRMIQVKTNGRETPLLREQIQAFGVPSGTTKEVWSFYDRRAEPVIHMID